MFSSKRFRTLRRPLPSARNRRVRLALEGLEARVTPASFVVVNTLDDLAEGSLRWAVAQANQNPGPDSITFDGRLGGLYTEGFLTRVGDPATITVGAGNLVVQGELSILGNKDLTISGGWTNRIFLVSSGASLSLDGVQLSNGTALFGGGDAGIGGAIRNDGRLELLNSSIASSRGSFGGAIGNSGTARIVNTTFTTNTAQRGGAIFQGATSGTLIVTSSTFTGNQAVDGGALSVLGGEVVIETSKLLQNTAQGGNGAPGEDGALATGGAISVSGGAVQIEQSTIAGNLAQGGQGGDGSDGGVGGTGGTGRSALPGFFSDSTPGGTGGTGGTGGPGVDGGRGGDGQGGGLFQSGGFVALAGVTLSDNHAVGGRGGDGGDGGVGGRGGAGGPIPPPTVFSAELYSGGDGGIGGVGGVGGAGGAGGQGLGGGVYSVGAADLTMVNATVAGNAARGGDGSKGGDGGNGGNGGDGAPGSNGRSDLGGDGGAGGKGGNGGASGAAGYGAAAGLYLIGTPSRLTHGTVAFNASNLAAQVTTAASGGAGGSPGQNASGRTTVVPGGASGAAGTLSAEAPFAAGGGIVTEDVPVFDWDLTLANSIVAQNTAAGAPSDVFGSLEFGLGTFNLIGTGGSGGLVNGANGNLVGVAYPWLSPLGDYGGTTRTVRVLPGSPAIDAGLDGLAKDAYHDPLLVDQRGRARKLGLAVDMGAFELGESEVVDSLVVTTLQDEDDEISDPRLGAGTSLREAIGWSNRNRGADTITFAPGLTGAITLTLGELTILDDAAMNGPGSGLLSISGNDASRIFAVTDGDDSSRRSVSLSGMTLTRGSAASGGAIWNAEDLTLTGVVVDRNESSTGGGGVTSSDGHLIVVDSTISNNVARAFAGGGIEVLGGEVLFVRATVTLNESKTHGGGIYSNRARLSMVDSTVSNNRTISQGGGMYVDGGQAEVLGSTLSGNSTLPTSLAGGGAAFLHTSVIVKNSTFSENRSGLASAFSSFRSDVSLMNTTVTKNELLTSLGRAAIESYPFSNLTITNSIVAGNTSIIIGRSSDNIATPAINPFPASTLTFQGRNILEGDPLLGPLADNGGPTLTHRPLAGSAAIDAGTPLADLTTDQRGALRSTSNPTIGAVELPRLRITATEVNLGTTTYGAAGTVAAIAVEASGFVDPLEITSSEDTALFPGVEFSADGQTWTTELLLANDSARFDLLARVPARRDVGDVVGELVFTNATDLDTPILLPYRGSVTPAVLTFVADAATRIYGDSNPAFTGSLAGLVLDDTLADIASGVLQFSSSATASSNVGQYSITGSGLTLTSPNYALAQDPSNHTALTVTARRLTLSASNRTKTYGDTLTFAGTEFVADGLLLSDQITGVTLASAGAESTAPVDGSPYAISIADAVGRGLENYGIAYVAGRLEVGRRALTLVGPSLSKTYGTAVSFTGTEFTVTGLADGDSIESVGLSSEGAAASATVAASPYPVIVSSPTGTGLENYVIAVVSGVLTVTPAPLTVTVPDATKIQGEANPTFVASYEGFVLTEGPGVLGGSLTFATTATAGSGPGVYAVTPGGLTSTNYAIRFVGGSLTVVGYAQTTNILLAEVQAAGLANSTRQPLTARLNAAIQAFSGGRTATGMTHLQGFIDLVTARRGTSIDTTLADRWIAYARRIRRAWNPSL